jgi:hypothetical protein
MTIILFFIIGIYNFHCCPYSECHKCRKRDSCFMNGTSFSSIRSEYYTYTSAESVYMYYFRDYVLSPLRYVVIISAIVE